ncbi:uncharacterized protein K02A2.6-like [Nilaparvata lugens]|uniref:uncharacterized protein K02A2.6-like n=1 Tax=Nilaparvata lugens TaxID=108931 RepID=UPI00193CDCB0|nr:uncharacterized protein K02A2.6-like [Nilaparvata lugens]
MVNPAEAGGGTDRIVVTGTIGRVYEFDLKENWSNWHERLSLYFSANDITEAKKVPILLTSIGTEGYGLFKDLCTPALPSSKSYAELVELMSNHLQPRPSEITERYKFKERLQKDDETIVQYIANLKKLSMNCGFGNNLESALRDQIVWGIRNTGIKKRLLSEPDLTYKKCIELSISLETTLRGVAELNATSNFTSSKINYNKSFRPSTSTNSSKPSRPNLTANPQFSTTKGDPGQWKKCYCCGKANHLSKNCHFRNYKCHVCGKQGHLKNVCKVRKTSGKQNNNYVESDSIVSQSKTLTEEFNCLDIASMNNLRIEKSINYVKPIEMKLIIESKPINFEVDTGSGISAICYSDFVKQFPDLTVKLKPTDEVFHSYVGDPIKPVGVVHVNCAINKNCKEKSLQLYVMKSNKEERNVSPILGRSWLQALKIDLGQLNSHCKPTIQGLNQVNDNELELEKVIKDYPVVFSDKLGKYTKRKFELHLKDDARPIFCKPRPIPYAIKDKVELEINRLVNENILTPVESSEYGTPIVPVMKPDGLIRLCGDYKVTINKMLMIDRHPIPRVDDLFVALRGGKKFSKLDLSQAYQQIELDEKSKKLVTISTHKGLFMYNRLPYGVASGPGLFQREIENLLRGLDNVVSFLDDIFITGKNDEEHIKNLKAVLSRLEDSGLTVKRSKCSFFQESISFLGHVIDAKGLHMNNDKVKAIVEAEPPTNVSELQAYLGLVNYYAKFLPDLSTVLSPMYELLRKDVKFLWSCKQEKAFTKSKELLLSGNVLVYFNPDLDIVLSCDASPYGLGIVLSHRFSNGDEKPIAYASRTLTKAEKGYSQLEKEALAIIFGVKHFHQYLYGKHFILKTDHKPLTTIFGPKNGIPQMTANRLQRWSIFLSGYDYEINYVRSKDNCNADGLSRLPLPSKTIDDEGEEYTYLNFVKSDVQCLNFFDVKKETAKDVVLSQVCEYVKYEWPDNSKIVDKLKPYFNRRNELYVDKDCLMLGNRIVIPVSLRKLILTELHSSHLGVVKMKSMARSYVWWPNIDSEIEEIAKSCKLCYECKSNPPKVTSAWKWPAAPGHRIHIDHCGPIKGKYYLLITDAYSKWLDVMEASSLTTDCTIDLLRVYFANWGIPLILVSDNATCFTADEFQKFVLRNGISHYKTAPFHPASNGAAENAVKTFKNKIEVLSKEMSNVKQAISKFLLEYRNTPHCTTGVSPAELHVGRRLLTRLDRIKPIVLAQKVLKSEIPARTCNKINFSIDDIVYVRNYNKNKSTWIKGKIIDQVSPVTFIVKTEDNLIWKRHVNQMRKFVEQENVPIVDNNLNLDELLKGIQGNEFVTPQEVIVPKPIEPGEVPKLRSPEPIPILRRSKRDRKPVKRFEL